MGECFACGGPASEIHYFSSPESAWKTIRVRDDPDREEYDEYKRLEEDISSLPVKGIRALIRYAPKGVERCARNSDHRETMTTYEIERPDGPERGVRVRCPEHGEQEEFQPGYQRVAFYCPGCGFEIEVRLHDTHDWRDWGERC